ncbi:MAG TPA: BatA domain-containing protein [Vicinamibacterales bacterium]|nr:BatA domain-containing protein [Vicinamibacterales bacterium]
MIFTTPLGLLALLSVPAIVAIHLFRRRFPPRQVAGLFLWQSARQVPQGGGRLDRLPITASLLLECLAALALSLILAGARLSSATVNDHLVVLLDDSASMSARSASGERARDRAARRVLEEMARLGSTGRITIIQSGDRPAVLAGPAALRAEGPAALERWQPQSQHHSLAAGLRLARELAGQTGRLMVLTDAAAGERGQGEVAGALWVAVGEPLANVGIIAAERTLGRDDGRGTISLALGNYSDAPQARRLTILAGDKPITTRELTAPPGVSSVKLPIAGGLPPLRVVLADDALARDNEVVLVEPQPQVVAVENRLADGRGRQALSRALAALTNVTAAESGHLQFVGADALDSPQSPGVWRAAFGRPPARLLAEGETQDFVGPFVMEKRHPLLLGVTLGGVVWAGASPLATPAIRPLVSAGERPLLATVMTSGRGTSILFNVDLERTNLIRSPDWPILISNLADMRRRELPGPERWNYRIGEWVRVQLGHDPKNPLRVRSRDGERTLPSGRVVEFTAPPQGGLIELLEGDETLFRLGANFLDETESNLRTGASAEAGQLNRLTPGLRSESGLASDPLFWVLLTTAAVAMVVNWCLPARQRIAGPA